MMFGVLKWNDTSHHLKKEVTATLTVWLTTETNPVMFREMKHNFSLVFGWKYDTSTHWMLHFLWILKDEPK